MGDLWPSRWRGLHRRAIQHRAQACPACQACEWSWLREYFEGLPCPECRRHALSHLESHPPDLSTSIAYQRWVFDFHNQVSARLEKPRPAFTYEQYTQLYAPELREKERRRRQALLP
jgi:hypothetical protein